MDNKHHKDTDLASCTNNAHILTNADDRRFLDFPESLSSAEVDNELTDREEGAVVAWSSLGRIVIFLEQTHFGD